MSKKTNDPIDTMLEPKKTAADIEKWIKDNAKTVAIALVVVIAIPLGYMGYKKFILEPKENEAYAAMFYAEQYFNQENFTLALNGDSEFSGFLTIIDEYGGTKAGNLANYYAGICYLKLGQFEDAINHLEDFSSDDILVSSVAAGALGDAYRELGDSEKAVKNYEKAANKYPNNFTSPIFLKKAGMTYEDDLAKPDKALACYEKIEKQYPMSREGQEIIKYISRTKAMMTE
ncbi:MAG: tetratricopeptide repeat protein [Flavobacteriales bacterium]|nr:tetratricopeptide repeat protein [Flavobacteriales bacterium]